MRASDLTLGELTGGLKIMYNTSEQFKTGYEKSKQRGNQGGPVEPSLVYVIYTKTMLIPLRCLVLGRHTDGKGGTSDKHIKIEASGPYGAGCGIDGFGKDEGGLAADPNSPTGVSGAKDHVAENFGIVAESEGPDDKFIGSILAGKKGVGSLFWSIRAEKTRDLFYLFYIPR
jgi:hypothetical protein